MIFSANNFFYALLFAATLFLVEGVYYLIVDSTAGRQRAINRRLQMMGHKGDARAVLRALRREESRSAVFTRLLPGLDRLIAQAGSTMPVTRLLAMMTALWLAIIILAKITLVVPLAISLVAASVLALLLPIGLLMQKRRKRLRRFGEQLPEALDLIVRSLYAGHPVATALGLVAKEMGDPAGTEFGILVDEMTYGIDMNEALRNMSARVPHADLQLLIVTIQIQHYTGGNLAEVLSNLSKVIRDRHYMVKKVRAVSAEGRMSAMVVGLLPFALIGFIMLVQPIFFTAVSADPLFVPMITCGFVLLVIGEYWIWRMVNFRI
jgi:tight adherence protein B